MILFEDYANLMEIAITIPKMKNLGIARKDMPQIATKDYPHFIKYLHKNGVRLTKTRIFPDELKPVQKDFSKAGTMKALRKPKEKPLIASSDNFIIDGHHRWLASYNFKPDTGLPVLKANIPVKALFQLVKDYPKATTKDIY